MGEAASANEAGVTSVEISPADGSATRATITFDEPVDRARAEAVRESLSASLADNGLSPETLGCQRRTDRQDANGMLTLQLTCLPTHASLAWGFRLAPQVQATVVGLVQESGLRWWRNSDEQSRNASHVVPSDYLFHGTMGPAHVNDVLDYQDVSTFRHSIGPGGTTRVVFAGSLQLTY